MVKPKEKKINPLCTDTLMKVKEVSEVLASSPRKIYRMVAEGVLIPAKNIGATCFFVSEINAYLEKLKNQRKGLK